MSKPKHDYGYGFNETNSIRIVWCIDDVKDMSKNMEIPIKLTDDDCMDILSTVDRQHDASIGVNWNTIQWAIENHVQEDHWDTAAKTMRSQMVSDCCNAEIKYQDICSSCLEHCDITYEEEE